MKVFNQKKGAVELSLNLIIMLVIGLTVLGLIISFVTSFLGNAENSFKGQLDQDDEVQLEQILNEEGNFAISPTVLTVPKGVDQASKLYIKVRNPSETSVTFTPTDGVLDDVESNLLSVVFSVGRGGDSAEANNIEAYVSPISLKAGEAGSYPIEVYAPGSVPAGTYYATFTLNVGDETYDEIISLNVE